jgi:uncharacterized protein with HEPN domain
MIKDDIVYLNHIMDAISRIEEYVHGLTYDNFIEKYLIQDGVIRQIQVIGEATKKISDNTRGKYPDIPWKDIAGMRDKLIHDYFGIDLDAVWDTVEKDIPVLKDEIQAVIKELKSR